MTTEVDPLDSLPSGVKLLLRHLHALIPENLSDINYPTWKITVLTALEANYLLKYVDGSTEPPPAVITNKKKPIRPMPPESRGWTDPIMFDCGHLSHGSETRPILHNCFSSVDVPHNTLCINFPLSYFSIA